MNTYEYVNSSQIRYTDSSGLRRDPPGICDGLPEGFGGDCKNRFFPPPPKCGEGGSCCTKSYSECYWSCMNWFNPIYIAPAAAVSTVGAICEIAVYEVAAYGLGGVLVGSTIGCAMVCSGDPCSW